MFHKFTIAAFARNFCDKRSSKVILLSTQSISKCPNPGLAVGTWLASFRFRLPSGKVAFPVSYMTHLLSIKMQLPSFSGFILICLILSDTKYTVSFPTLNSSPDLWRQWASNNWIHFNPEVDPTHRLRLESHPLLSFQSLEERARPPVFLIGQLAMSPWHVTPSSGWSFGRMGYRAWDYITCYDRPIIMV